MSAKTPKIFITHSRQDEKYASCLVDFLEDIGLSQEHLFCPSVPEYGFPLNQDIYEYLKKQFQTHNLHVIFILSNNYYQSVYCLIEMGVAWILQSKYTTVLLPSFKVKEIQGAIPPLRLRSDLKLDADLTDLKIELERLKDDLLQEFGLPAIRDLHWREKRDKFITAITKCCKPVNPSHSDSALEMLRIAWKEV